MSATKPVRRPISKSDYERLAAFRATLRRFLHFSEEAAGAAGLTPRQHQALLAVQGMPGRDHATMGELAERLQIKHHSAVELVNRLESAGLMQREQSPDDGRLVWLRLTAKGLTVLSGLSALHRTELRWLGPDLHAALARILEERNAWQEEHQPEPGWLARRRGQDA
ncbi:MAG TPA: MarR family transcriptional regulator [Opitutaceae bacterium]